MNVAKEILNLIEVSNKIVITSHKSPDGDSIGSSMAFYHFLKALGKQSTICHPDACPAFINWLKGDIEIHTFESDELFVTSTMNEADLIICLDYNVENRLGAPMGDVLVNSKAKKVMIDHHMFPGEFADFVISEPEICSTAQLVYQFIEDSGKGDLMNSDIGTPIYLGIVTDTGSFRFPSVNSKTHTIVADLIDRGVNTSKIHQDTFDDNTIDKLKLRGHILAQNLEIVNGNVAIVHVSRNELKEFNYIKGDTEGLVNMALSIRGVVAAMFLTEDVDKVKMSFRSKGDYFVNELAGEHFNGGGHKYASGGMSTLSLDDTIKKLKEHIPNYFNA